LIIHRGIKMSVTVRNIYTGTTLALEKVKDIIEDKKTPIPRKDVYHRAPPSTEAPSYSDSPYDIIILARLTGAERIILHGFMSEAMVMSLAYGGEERYAWLEIGKQKYRHTEHFDAPWLATLHFVIAPRPALGEHAFIFHEASGIIDDVAAFGEFEEEVPIVDEIAGVGEYSAEPPIIDEDLV